jgi:pimeloyl-ACP methyl ester carboxylesterase
MKTKEITFNNVTLYSENFGLENNPTLLLIMGAGSSSIWWEDCFCEMLSEKGFFVIRYDNRDTGKSTCYMPGKPEYTFEEMADDAIQVLNAYNKEKAIIMGMSMGGMLAQMIALRHPERLNGIVLLSAMYFAEGADNLPYSSDEVNAFFESFSQCIPKTKENFLKRALEQQLITRKSRRPKDIEHIRELVRVDIERANNYASTVNHACAQVTGDELTCIAEIKTPTLVIHGTDDVVIPYIHGEMLAKTIPEAVLITLEGAGHELHPFDYEHIIESITNKFCKNHSSIKN